MKISPNWPYEDQNKYWAVFCLSKVKKQVAEKELQRRTSLYSGHALRECAFQRRSLERRRGPPKVGMARGPTGKGETTFPLTQR